MCAYGRGSQFAGKGEGHKNGNSISGRGSEFKLGEAGIKGFEEEKANTQQTANETPEKAQTRKGRGCLERPVTMHQTHFT